MECWFDLERHLDAEIIGLRVGVHEIGPVLKKIVTNSRTRKTRKLSRDFLVALAHFKNSGATLPCDKRFSETLIRSLVLGLRSTYVDTLNTISRLFSTKQYLRVYGVLIYRPKGSNDLPKWPNSH